MEFALRALKKNRTDRVQIIVRAAAQRTRPCLRHLKTDRDHMSPGLENTLVILPDYRIFFSMEYWIVYYKSVILLN